MLNWSAQMVAEKQLTSESEEFMPLLDQLAGQVNSKVIKRKTFSAISKREYDAMCEELNVTAAGTVHFAEADVLLGEISIPDSFKQQVELVSHLNVSGTEMGCHLNIGIYLTNAVYLARKYLNAGRIALFSEVPFEHDNLPGIGEIAGNLDYITSGYAGVKEIGTCSNAQVRLKTPYLLVVEEKSNSTIGRFSSFYQLITQLITVDYHNSAEEGRWGCLTSGDRWDFYFLRKRVEQNADGEDIVVAYELFDLEDVKVDAENGMQTVMGILIHLVGKLRPSMSDIVKLEEEDEWAGLDSG